MLLFSFCLVEVNFSSVDRLENSEDSLLPLTLEEEEEGREGKKGHPFAVNLLLSLLPLPPTQQQSGHFVFSDVLEDDIWA